MPYTSEKEAPDHVPVSWENSSEAQPITSEASFDFVNCEPSYPVFLLLGSKAPRVMSAGFVSWCSTSKISRTAGRRWYQGAFDHQKDACLIQAVSGRVG